jgi:carboxyl-terminal processing protease
MKLNRRTFVSSVSIGLTSLVSKESFAQSRTPYALYFMEVWRKINSKYCYFGEKKIDWERARSIYGPLATLANNNDEFKTIIGDLLRELYDPHTHVFNTPIGTPRWPIYDIFGQMRGENIVVSAVQAGSSAFDAGVKTGDIILEIDGIDAHEARRKFTPKSLVEFDLAAQEFAINQALAGNVGMPRTIKISNDGNIRDVPILLKSRDQKADIESKIIEGNIGYVAINSFANDSAIAEFDNALDRLQATNGLIIDVRNNGGGDTAVARPIMGRFISSRKPYAKMSKRAGTGLGNMWIETVNPRGPFMYDKPVVVLCNHWSASMAEGFPMGMRAIANAKIIGTRMMGLGAAVYTHHIPIIDLSFQYSAEPVYDVNGNSRSNLIPDIEISNDEDFIAIALRELQV